ncbi:hypothetical protein HYU16_03490 [Candidatus Woesearchaeota archaeon]|nr:hypothetical protein [Candidatus Woesearchaeota archaeon]
MAVLGVTALRSLTSRLDKRQKIAIAAVAFLLILFLASRLTFWTMIFIVVASMAETYNARFRTPVHLDFVKLGTVLTASAYGAPIGIFVGIASTFFSKLFSARLDFTILISLIGITLMAILADAFSGASITALGIVLVLLYYLITTPINLMLGEEPGYAFAYVVSSVAVNVVLFSQVAPRLIGLL